MERRYTARLRVRTPLVAAVLATGWWAAAPLSGGEPLVDPLTDRYWQFLEHTNDPGLRLLPPMAEPQPAAPESDAPESDAPESDAPESDAPESGAVEGPMLLPPMHLPAVMAPPAPARSGMIGQHAAPVDLNEFVAGATKDTESKPVRRKETRPSKPTRPTVAASVDVAKAASTPVHEETPAAARTPRLSEYTATVLPTGSRVQQLAQASVRRGYDFAKRGAYFTAEREFIEALKLVTRQKDLQSGRASRSEALAAGLRALDEAEDFFPGGLQLHAELDVAAIRASHLTKLEEPLTKEPQAQHVLDLYLRYAQVQLGAAVSGEPAGSMALHALGKLQSQLGRVEPARNPIAAERAVALQQAALLSREDNYLAAHELGLLLAEAGRLNRAEEMLANVAARQPNAVVLRNLAAVQKRLGQDLLAQQSLAQADTLARAGRGGGGAIQTVSPQQFAQTSNRSQTHRSASQGAPQQAGGSGLRVAGREMFRAVPAGSQTSTPPAPRPGTDFVSPAARWR